MDNYVIFFALKDNYVIDNAQKDNVDLDFYNDSSHHIVHDHMLHDNENDVHTEINEVVY